MKGVGRRKPHSLSERRSKRRWPHRNPDFTGRRVMRKPRLAGGRACEEESSSICSSLPSQAPNTWGKSQPRRPPRLSLQIERSPQPCVPAVTRRSRRAVQPEKALISSHGQLDLGQCVTRDG